MNQTDENARRVWFAIQTALQGAASTHGRIGKQLLAQTLGGSNSKKLRPLRLDRLPAYGQLKQLNQETINELIAKLLSEGWLVQIELTRFRPIIQISESGKALLQTALDQSAVESIGAELAQTIVASLTEPDGATRQL